MTEREALIALNLIPDLDSLRLKNLRDAFGSAAKIFVSPENRLRQIDKITTKIVRQIVSFPFENLKKELELCRKLKINIITINDEDYPENLKNIYDPPFCLYIKGNLQKDDSLALGVVGSRRASFYGLSCAEKFSYSLAEKGITIVSGLARGVDTYAHRGALKAKGRTLAILGSGLNYLYPPENRKLADEVSASGALISEFALNTPPMPSNFPRRNRVISGLSMGIIVVEAAKNSGALITADCALEQGREVFALPGKVDSSTSFGTNGLIKQGAKLVSCVDDIIEELKPELSRKLFPGGEIAKRKPIVSEALPADEPQEKKAQLSNEEELVYNILGPEGNFVDEIIEGAKLPSNRVLSLLSQLELRNLIRQLPGKVFARKG